MTPWSFTPATHASIQVSAKQLAKWKNYSRGQSQRLSGLCCKKCKVEKGRSHQWCCACKGCRQAPTHLTAITREVRPAGQGSRQTRRYLAAYTQANQLADISVSADPFVAFPMANLIISKGVKVVRESDEALKKRSHAQVLTLSVRSQTTEEVLASLDSVSGARSKL
ncbi:unnamed protein product [Effrenium voratum]|uniref:Uncharacterized protein n=1 Tax=Effrenium voratum TaxID=2562239 RepID=A0AA36IFJ4_9DINO|nr:unnamed protein product [Effrenium voratum]